LLSLVSIYCGDFGRVFEEGMRATCSDDIS
jgi:hypothetical protein